MNLYRFISLVFYGRVYIIQSQSKQAKFSEEVDDLICPALIKSKKGPTPISKSIFWGL